MRGKGASEHARTVRSLPGPNLREMAGFSANSVQLNGLASWQADGWIEGGTLGVSVPFESRMFSLRCPLVVHNENGSAEPNEPKTWRIAPDGASYLMGMPFSFRFVLAVGPPSHEPDIEFRDARPRRPAVAIWSDFGDDDWLGRCSRAKISQLRGRG